MWADVQGGRLPDDAPSPFGSTIHLLPGSAGLAGLAETDAPMAALRAMWADVQAGRLPAEPTIFGSDISGDMVEMSVGKEQVEIDRRLPRQLTAERPDARARVEDHQVSATPHFDAGRVTTISHRLGTRGRYAASDAPEPDGEVCG